MEKIIKTIEYLLNDANPSKVTKRDLVNLASGLQLFNNQNKIEFFLEKYKGHETTTQLVNEINCKINKLKNEKNEKENQLKEMLIDRGSLSIDALNCQLDLLSQLKEFILTANNKKILDFFNLQKLEAEKNEIIADCARAFVRSYLEIPKFFGNPIVEGPSTSYECKINEETLDKVYNIAFNKEIIFDIRKNLDAHNKKMKLLDIIRNNEKHLEGLLEVKKQKEEYIRLLEKKEELFIQNKENIEKYNKWCDKIINIEKELHQSTFLILSKKEKLAIVLSEKEQFYGSKLKTLFFKSKGIQLEKEEAELRLIIDNAQKDRNEKQHELEKLNSEKCKNSELAEIKNLTLPKIEAEKKYCENKLSKIVETINLCTLETEELKEQLNNIQYNFINEEAKELFEKDYQSCKRILDIIDSDSINNLTPLISLLILQLLINNKNDKKIGSIVFEQLNDSKVFEQIIMEVNADFEEKLNNILTFNQMEKKDDIDEELSTQVIAESKNSFKKKYKVLNFFR